MKISFDARSSSFACYVHKLRFTFYLFTKQILNLHDKTTSIEQQTTSIEKQTPPPKPTRSISLEGRKKLLCKLVQHQNETSQTQYMEFVLHDCSDAIFNYFYKIYSNYFSFCKFVNS